MKKNVFTLLAGTALLCACQPAQKETTISGTLTGIESDTLLVINAPMPTASNENNQSKTDTVAMQDGKFTLTLACDSLPVQAVIFAKPSGNKALNMAQNIRIVAFPGDALTVNGSVDDYVVEGSDFYATLNEAQKTWQPAQDSLMAIFEKYKGIDPEDLPEGTNPTEEIQEAGKRLTALYVDYIRQHPDEDVSVYLAAQTGTYMEEALGLLSDKAKNGILGGFYQYMDAMMQKEKALEEAEAKIKEGAEAPDFTLNDLQGKPLALSSLRGKYVVLDFWGSWCGWCIKGIPDMKKYYEKYKGKMEILGIDCRDTEEKWKAAVEKHELPWLHVRNEGNPDVSILYAIQGYPTKIVVDPEGKIAKIVVGEDPAFYEYLDELFK